MITMTEEDKQFFNEMEKFIVFDEEQKSIILNDDKVVYVVAGAGSGKSTVLAGRIKYLLEVKKVKPEEILVMSYTKKSVEDLANKIKAVTDKKVLVKTFHAEGLEIFSDETGKKNKSSKPISLRQCIKNFFANEILNDKEIVKKIILFFSSYMYVPFKYGDADLYLDYLVQNEFYTLRQDIELHQDEIKDELRNEKTSLAGEAMESKEEVDIANFLYLNGIDYKYEIPYITAFPNSSRSYNPDFKIEQNGRVIYIEHYGVTEDGENTRFNKKTLNLYNQHIKDKRALHKENGTELIENYSVYRDGKPFILHLEEDLKKAGIIFNKRDDVEVLSKLVEASKSKYLNKLYKLMTDYINLFFEQGLSSEDIDNQINNVRANGDERSLLFLEICKKFIVFYESYLEKNEIIDFNHMIKNSTEFFKQNKELKYFKKVKYIIIDEYQDITGLRCEFLKTMVEHCGSKLMVVGDDWQSIYKFAGSELKKFTEFEKHFPGAKRVLISRTYRNPQELIDIAGKFIMKNNDQIKKNLISDKSMANPVKVYTYDSDDMKQYSSDDFITRENKAVGEKLVKILEEIKNSYENNCPPVLVLGRYNQDCKKLEKSGLFDKSKVENNIVYLNPTNANIADLTVVFSTVHSAKGLGFENVVLINCKDDVYGFPCKLEDDPVLNLLKNNYETIEYAEERRLFYVAMTRTKNRFYIVAPYDRPSQFLLEIVKENESIEIVGKSLVDKSSKKEIYKCPDCGFPLLYKENSLLKTSLWICSNNPISCGFVTNQLCSQKLRIEKCSCGKGYLIVKPIGKRNIENYELEKEIVPDPTKPDWYNRPYQLGCTEFENGCKITKFVPMANFVKQRLKIDQE